MSSCLDRFYEASDHEQSVIQEKSAIFFSKLVNHRGAASIAATLHMLVTHNLGCYLGVPILNERISNATYQNILDRFDQKLIGWKVVTLSLLLVE
ncbi:hypothetical protein LINPERHAP1_LOCUS34456 [Linum perenne]